MLVLRERNVNGLFSLGVQLLRKAGVRQSSRNGDVIVTPFPVTSVYERSTERVLFDSVRDANPFFHLMESLWMLAGRDDAAFLNQFVKDFGARYAEEDGRLHGAYGYRWRHHFFVLSEEGHGPWQNGEIQDQLLYTIDALRKDPNDRRVVISMWSPGVDLGASKKDVPCNTQIYPRVVKGALDITVMCRSNDIIWGAYGANAVHFSVLQEYLAAGIGCQVGTMYQLSNNYHAYVDILDKQNPATDRTYENGRATALPLIDHFEMFDEEVQFFCDNPTAMAPYQNSFLSRVAVPAASAYASWREKKQDEALQCLMLMPTCDWKLACLEWFERRSK